MPHFYAIHVYNYTFVVKRFITEMQVFKKKKNVIVICHLLANIEHIITALHASFVAFNHFILPLIIQCSSISLPVLYP
jgi:hypothetical protein